MWHEKELNMYRSHNVDLVKCNRIYGHCMRGLHEEIKNLNICSDR